MFVGESGSWLVVFLAWAYRQYIAPRFSNHATPLLAGGYNPVHNEDRLDDDGEEDQTISGPDYADDPSKPLDEGRVQLQGSKIFLLAAPACCDIAGTTLMNVGLLFVAASIYQMTRGALVLFVGLFSVIFLHRKLHAYQWSALFVVVLGVALVGLAGALFGDNPTHEASQDSTPMAVVRTVAMEARTVAQTPEAVKTIIGVLLIAAAQIFTASQFVLEEWILENYAMDPLRVVGWEGVFGFSVTVVASIILHLAVGRTPAGRYGYFDAREGWSEVFHHRTVAMSSILIMISIGYAFPPFLPFHFILLSLAYLSIVDSTSSASPSPTASLPPRAARSTRAARCSSGSCRWVSAGSPSSGSRSSGSGSLSTEPSSSMTSSGRL